MRCPKPVTLLCVFTVLLFAGALSAALTQPGRRRSAAAPTAARKRRANRAEAGNTAPPQAKPAAPAPAAPAQAPATPPAGYVGTETCATCHTGYDTSINASKHGLAKHPGTPAAAQGCEIVPRSGRSAHQRSGEDQAEAAHQDCSQGSQRHLHDLPQQGRACACGRAASTKRATSRASAATASTSRCRRRRS